MQTQVARGPLVVVRRAVQTSKASFHTSLSQRDSVPFSFRPLLGIDDHPSSSSPRSPSRSPPSLSKAPALKASPDQQEYLREPRSNSLGSSYNRTKKKSHITFGDIHKNQTQARPPSSVSEASKPRSPVSSYRTRDRFSHFAGAVSSNQASSKHGGRSQFELTSTRSGMDDAAGNGDRNRSERSYKYIRPPAENSDNRSDSSFRSKQSSRRNQQSFIQPDQSPIQLHEDRRPSFRDHIRSANQSGPPLSQFALKEDSQLVATRTRPGLSSPPSTPSVNPLSDSLYKSSFLDPPTASAPDQRIVLEGTTLGHTMLSQTATAEEQRALSDLEAILRAQDGNQRRKTRAQSRN